jgi:hypothetical protein
LAVFVADLSAFAAVFCSSLTSNYFWITLRRRFQRLLRLLA